MTKIEHGPIGMLVAIYAHYQLSWPNNHVRRVNALTILWGFSANECAGIGGVGYRTCAACLLVYRLYILPTLVSLFQRV